MPPEVNEKIWQVVIYPNGKRPKDVRKGSEPQMRAAFEAWKHYLYRGEKLALRNDREEVEVFVK